MQEGSGLLDNSMGWGIEEMKYSAARRVHYPGYFAEVGRLWEHSGKGRGES